MTPDSERGIITKIEQQKKNAKRFNIYINDRYTFSVHEDVLVSNRLAKGKEVTIVEIEELMQQEERKKVELAGIRYLSYRPRTCFEMKEHLKQKGFELEIIQMLIERWLKEGYLNDYDFAQQWVEERIAYKRKGRQLISEELRHKGIPSEIIQQVLQNLNDTNEILSCVELIRKKMRTMDDIQVYQNKMKLYQFLQRRGFTFDIIQQAFQQIIEER